MIRQIRKIIDEDGFGALNSRGRAWVERRLQSHVQELQARWLGSYRHQHSLQLHPRLNKSILESIAEPTCIPAELAEHYLEHRFDLLGSGWTQVHYGMNCRGLEGYRYEMGTQVVPDSSAAWLEGRINRSNLKYAQAVWSHVDVDYQPIDWQLDFKSGFRWSENVWAKKLVYGNRLGVDIKVPWELARMQHLPQLALRALALGKNHAEGRRLVCEVRNQILDFITTNPPGFGVNWLCPMDIAIRAANWLLAWDVLRTASYSFEPNVDAILANSIHDHGAYVMNHLEWSPSRGNHYLANICGIAFIAAYLPPTDETNAWLAFTIQQLNIEVLHQFHRDGGNFEGSISYHRLSGEMVLYVVALILGLPASRLQAISCADLNSFKPRPTIASSNCGVKVVLHSNAMEPKGSTVNTAISLDCTGRLAAIVDFFDGVLKPSGLFPQIGDNDSGRFFKCQPVYYQMTVGKAKATYANLKGYAELNDSVTYFFEQHLNGLHLLDAASGLGWKPISKPPHSLAVDDNDKGRLDYTIIKALAQGRTMPGITVGQRDHQLNVTSAQDSKLNLYQIWGASIQCLDLKKKIYRFSTNINLESDPLDIREYPDFGCYTFRSTSIYVAVRCLNRIINTNSSHFHEDQLSIELDINGRSLISDPGTFVYTPLPNSRNQYRSQEAHFAPVCYDAVNLTEGDHVFRPLKNRPATVNYFGPQGFAAEISTKNYTLGLLLKFEWNSIELMHYCTGDAAITALSDRTIIISPGYGIQELDAA